VIGAAQEFDKSNEEDSINDMQQREFYDECYHTKNSLGIASV
jgi:hypothetical protein